MYARKLMFKPRIFITRTLAVAALAALAGCSSLKKAVDAIPVPSMPDLSSVTSVIPGLGPSGDSVSAADPVVPFNSKGVLGYGHTLRLAVYDGVVEPRKLYAGLVMIDEHGVADFGKFGTARLGGHTISEARRLIESVFIRTGGAASRTHVHFISVENVTLITVEGDVVSPLTTPLWKNMTMRDAIAAAGGRRPGSTAKAVYVIQNGQRRFYQTVEAADYGSPLRAGDIITLSPDL
ncbi:MAG: hypothetical protein JWO94_1697 [Verrucomicrobiaceae bacterium]|nr:hypothetical protein [Verrucomicrobiaceae bacterium]